MTNKITFSRIKRKALKHLWIWRIALLIGLFTAIILPVSLLVSLLNKSNIPHYLSFVSDFIFAPSDKIQTKDDRTNILLMGKGGGDHDSPDLTDTMIFISLSHKSNHVTTISIPRDLWIPDLQAKVNSAYYWGNKQSDNPGAGISLAKATVEDIVGVPIHYAVVIDFSGFTKIIDILGGIEVNVENTFTDPMYPIAGKENDNCNGDTTYACRYETITFTKGLQQMDGATALKFVRSRHSEGDEGNDFARNLRQQKVIAAIKTKILTPEVMFSIPKVKEILDLINKNLETDLTDTQKIILARKALNAGRVKDGVKQYAINMDFLDNPPISRKYYNAFVLIPKGGNWHKIQDWVKSLLP